MGQLAGVEGVAGVILAEGAFEEACARLQCQSGLARDFVDTLHTLHFEEACCFVAVVYDVADDCLAAVAGLGEELVLVGREYLVVPGHFTELLELLEVEVGAPEVSDAVVVVACGLVGAAVGVLQVVVDVAEVAPRPSAAACGDGAVEAYEHRRLRQAVDDEVRGFVVEVGGVRLHEVELVGVLLQVGLRAEEGVGADGVLRHLVEVARGGCQGNAGVCDISVEVHCVR